MSSMDGGTQNTSELQNHVVCGEAASLPVPMNHTETELIRNIFANFVFDCKVECSFRFGDVIMPTTSVDLLEGAIPYCGIVE